MKRPILLTLCASALALARTAVPFGGGPQVPHPAPEYTIEAIRYASVAGFPKASLVMGAPRDERVDIALVIWLIRRRPGASDPAAGAGAGSTAGGGRIILFDSGYHRAKWTEQFKVTDFLPPDEAVRLAGVEPAQVTDVIISHAHWDHLGGLDRFPNATVWIQRAEYDYYTGEAWQPGGRKGGIDPDDITELVRRNLRGQVRLVNGDNIEVLPGIRVFTGARHTYASQYVRVDGAPPFVLASDNCYLYENLATHRASATFDRSDESANLAAHQRMIQLAGSPQRVVPGHDPAQFTRFPAQGRIARIR